MSSFKFITVIAFLAMAPSCSVKEDRSACLCCLGLDFSDCRDNGDGIVLIGWDGKMTESFKDFPNPDSRGAYCEYYVPRCDFTLSASVGAEVTDDRRIMLRSGEQADSLYACMDRFGTDAEYCYRKLRLNKQFTTVRIISAAAENLQDSIIVRGNAVGVQLPEMIPVPGEYSFCVQETQGGIFPFRLYRQSGRIEVSMPRPESRGSARTIDLSGILEKCGYDWSEASLRDVDLYLDKSMTSVSVRISDWSYSGTITVEI